MNEKALVTFSIDAGIKQELKIFAVKNGLTMSEIVTKLIQELLEQERKNESKSK